MPRCAAHRCCPPTLARLRMGARNATCLVLFVSLRVSTATSLLPTYLPRYLPITTIMTCNRVLYRAERSPLHSSLTTAQGLRHNALGSICGGWILLTRQTYPARMVATKGRTGRHCTRTRDRFSRRASRAGKIMKPQRRRASGGGRRSHRRKITRGTPPACWLPCEHNARRRSCIPRRCT